MVCSSIDARSWLPVIVVASPCCRASHSFRVPCIVHRSGMPTPWYHLGPWTTTSGRCWLIRNTGNPASRMGIMILWHWALDRLLAIRGYSKDFMMQYCIENHASACENRPDLTFSAHSVAFSHSAWVCDFWLPSMAMYTPKVSLASCTSNRSNSTLDVPGILRIVILPGFSSRRA